MCVWVSRGDHSFHQVLRGPDTQGHRMVARMACHTHLIPAIQGLLHQSPKSRTLDLAQDASVCLPSSPLPLLEPPFQLFLPGSRLRCKAFPEDTVHC